MEEYTVEGFHAKISILCRMTTANKAPNADGASGPTRAKKRKLSRVEMKYKLMESVKEKDRWWNIWNCEPSGTIASVVGSPLREGEATELIWDQKGFENLFKLWIEEHRGRPSLNPELFTR